MNNTFMPDLSGQVIFITGASGGLGEGVTQAFLNSGATVVGVARSWKGRSPGVRFVGLEADLLRPEECRRAVQEAGRLDAVVHLMGGFAGGQPVQETDEATWDRMLSMNLTSAFYVMRAALPALVAQGHGRIIAVSARASLEPGANLSAYNASKAGLNALVRTVAAEVRGTGVTANAVLPSIIDTSINRAAMPGADFSKWVTPASIASLLLWLVSDAAADVNGALIPIYGQV